MSVVGCSIYQPTHIPDALGEQPSHSGVAVIEKGATVRITLRDHQQISGRVISVSPKELHIGDNGTPGLESRVISKDDIYSIEVLSPTPGSTLVGIGVGVLVVWFAYVLSNFRMASE
jgi:hypothetical protein